MATITPIREYSTIDKSAWGDGPWQGEPDKVQWVDADTGLDCLAVRHIEMGHWCGYVGVPPDHKFHGIEYETVNRELDYEPQELTFSDSCRESEPQESAICHIPLPGRDAEIWWLGFDFAHSGDLSPGMVAVIRRYNPDYHQGDVYRDLPYVQAECAKLAKQLVA